MPYSPLLDLLRFGAALVVVVAHTRGHLFVDFGGLDAASRGIGNAFFYFLTRLGHEAVILFFVISGYLVGGRLASDSIAGTLCVSKFMVDRFSRIIIPIVPVIIIGAMLFPNDSDVVQLFGNVVGLQGIFVNVLSYNSPLWSLAYEIWFYIIGLCAAIVYYNKKASIYIVLLFALIFCVFTQLKLYLMFCWLIGALVRIQQVNLSKVGCYSLILCLAIMILLRQVLTDGVFNIFFGGDLFVHLTEMSIAVVFAYLISAGRSINWSLPGMRTCAAFSYSLYLVHFPLLMIVKENLFQNSLIPGLQNFLYFILVVFLQVFVAYCFFILFEKNTVAIKKYIFGGLYGR